MSDFILFIFGSVVGSGALLLFFSIRKGMSFLLEKYTFQSKTKQSDFQELRIGKRRGYGSEESSKIVRKRRGYGSNKS